MKSSSENDEGDDDFCWYCEYCGFAVRLSVFGLFRSPLVLLAETSESVARRYEVALAAAGWSILYTPLLLLVVWWLHPLKRDGPTIKKVFAVVCSSTPVLGFWGSYSYLLAVA